MLKVAYCTVGCHNSAPEWRTVAQEEEKSPIVVPAVDGLLGAVLTEQSDCHRKEGPAVSRLRTFWVKKSDTGGATQCCQCRVIANLLKT